MSLRLLLEGESLLNDASSITLFTIFLQQVQEYRNGVQASGGEVLGSIISKMLWLAIGKPMSEGAATDSEWCFQWPLDFGKCCLGPVRLINHSICAARFSICTVLAPCMPGSSVIGYRCVGPCCLM